MYSLASGEKGKAHTVVVCVSASGHAIPPFMIYPRKRAVPESMKIGAVPGTIFMTSDNGWITQEIYFEWFKFFIKSISPPRPVLLIEDGHGSHITLDVIELAHKIDIHLLCLPSHTSHILQPLDIGVFKSFESGYSKACRKYIMENPGRVITSEVIASLVGETWAHSITPMNILSGFKKSGISPLNPSEVFSNPPVMPLLVHHHRHLPLLLPHHRRLPLLLPHHQLKEKEEQKRHSAEEKTRKREEHEKKNVNGKSC